MIIGVFVFFDMDVVISVCKFNFVEKMGNFGNIREFGGEMLYFFVCKYLFW